MAFASDRDLLAIDPRVFADAAWVSRRVVSGTGSVSGTALTLTGGGPTFEAAGVGAGGVVVVAGRALEVVARTGASVVTVSALRADASAAAIPPGDGTGLAVEVIGFGAELGLVHRQVLRMLGIEPEDTWSEDPLREQDVVNPEEFAVVEALGALHVIYAAAAAAGPVGGEMARRAEEYRERFAAERRRAAGLIDLDGDGKPDATRRLNAVVFVRV
jgi:hypothetical protein